MEEAKIFFVLGAPKSGTTWLQHLLNAHPNVSCRGEGKFHFFISRLQDLSGRYNSALAKSREWIGVEFPPMTNEELIHLVREFISLRLLRTVSAGKTNLLWVGEKDPDHTFHIKSMVTLFPKAAFIHIIRDPRDRAVSLYFHINRTGWPKSDWRKHMLEHGTVWANAVTEVRRRTKQHDVRYHELRYEDLLDRPIETATAVFNFLGVDTSPVAQCIEAASFERLSGRKPGQEDQASFFRKGIIGDWRNHMDTEMERAFAAATGGLMAELGYL